MSEDNRGSGAKRLRSLRSVWLAAKGDPTSAIALVAALALSVLAVFSVLESAEALTGATLGTLALVASSLLVEGTRRRTSEVQATQERHDAQRILSDLSNQVKVLDGHRRLRIYPVETEEAKDFQRQLIREVAPVSVRMWEHSASTARFVVESLAKCDAVEQIQLLIANPIKAMSWYRVQPMVYDFGIILSDRPELSLEIRCYDQPSVRGRNYDDRFVAVGWYTFDERPELGWPQAAGPPVWGAHNAIVIADCATPDGAALRESFNKSFDATWQSGVPLREAVKDRADAHMLSRLDLLAEGPQNSAPRPEGAIRHPAPPY